MFIDEHVTHTSTCIIPKDGHLRLCVMVKRLSFLTDCHHDIPCSGIEVSLMSANTMCGDLTVLGT